MKNYIEGHPEFSKLLAEALRLRNEKIPEVEIEIQTKKRKLADLDSTEQDLRQKVLSSEFRDHL